MIKRITAFITISLFLISSTHALDKKAACQEVLSPEGEFINVFNTDVADWIGQEIDKKLLSEIREKLAPQLYIKLNKRGFAPAATRGEKDTTHYDAIWVRDNVWVYYALRKDSARQADARKLLLALWDYYATNAQVDRFTNIIKNPSLSTDFMAMPHIRFDGSSPDLSDVMIDGKPQEWNHRQIDAHGIFFTSLAEAAKDGFITESDLTQERARVLSLYPLFLERIEFYDYEDAGAWEEIERKNTSSIALATRSLGAWKEIIYKKRSPEAFRKKLLLFIEEQDSDIVKAWSDGNLEGLIEKGLKTVERQLKLGGESPDYLPRDIHFRLADAALMFLIVPSAVKDLDEDQMRKAILIVETLKRPAGVLRYNNDSYQSGNFWIKKKESASLTADTSSKDAFLARLKSLIPNTEAQWFFDSLLCLARLRLAKMTEDAELRREDIYLATVHLKRALGQITGYNMITADENPVEAWLLPESINTVVVGRERHFASSPIVPLNWAKAALLMALSEYNETL